MSRLTERQIAIRDMTREFVRKEVTPYAAQWDRDASVPLDTLGKIGALGLFGVCIPEQWGGAGADFISYVLATEEIAYGDAGICNMVSASNSYGFKIRDFGTPEQKERFLRPVASGDVLGCMLLTEPQAGSDAANLRTRAVRRGDHYVINGTKSLITSGRSAALAVVVAVTDPDAGKRGISAFLTPTDQPGYNVIRVEHKLGHRSNDTCQIQLDNLEVPAANLLGEPGRGLKVAFSGLDSGRIGVAAQSIGVARAAFDAAMSLCAGARGVRQKADGASGDRVQAGRDGDRDRSRAADVPSCRRAERRTGAMHQGGFDVQVVRLPDVRARLLGGDSDPWRLRVYQRLPGREILPRRTRLSDLRWHQRGAKNPDFPRTRGRTLTGAKNRRVCHTPRRFEDRISTWSAWNV